MYKELAALFKATEATPLRVAGVEFWIDATGPWAGQLSYSVPASLWNPRAMGEEIAALAKAYPEVVGIVLKYA